MAEKKFYLDINLQGQAKIRNLILEDTFTGYDGMIRFHNGKVEFYNGGWTAINDTVIPNIDEVVGAGGDLESYTLAVGDFDASTHGDITTRTTPLTANSVVNRTYVDNIAQGLDAKTSVKVATIDPITLSGTQTIDNIPVVAGDRVLVKNQSSEENNGIYIVDDSAWTRAADMDNWSEVPGAFVFVEEGNDNADTGWVCTTDASGTLGTTVITWTQFSGAGSYTASNGILLSGTNFTAVAETNRGLAVTASGIGLATGFAGNALELTSNVLNVVATANKGLTVTSSGIELNSGVAGDGLNLTSGVLKVVAEASKGLAVTSSGIGLDSGVAGDALDLTSGVLKVLATSGKGLTVTASGVEILPDTATAKTISINLTANGAGVQYDDTYFDGTTSLGLKLSALGTAMAGNGITSTAGVLSSDTRSEYVEITTLTAGSATNAFDFTHFDSPPAITVYDSDGNEIQVQISKGSTHYEFTSNTTLSNVTATAVGVRAS